MDKPNVIVVAREDLKQMPPPALVQKVDALPYDRERDEAAFDAAGAKVAAAKARGELVPPPPFPQAGCGCVDGERDGLAVNFGNRPGPY